MGTEATAAGRVLARGLGLVESARWHGGDAWFSDWLSGIIYRVAVGSGEVSRVAVIPSLPLCFDFVGDDLVVLDSAGSRVLRGPVGGALVPWADLSPLGTVGNEIVGLADGGCYLNLGNFDPAVGFPTSPTGVIAYLDPSGAARVVADQLAFPNGMAVSADATTLIVAESHAGRLTGFGIGPDGALGARRVWAQVADSAPDGISLAPSGECWYADVPNRQVVCVAEHRTEPTRVIGLDRGGFSCAVSPDGRQLLVVGADWANGAGMVDPNHDWDGLALVIDL